MKCTNVHLREVVGRAVTVVLVLLVGTLVQPFTVVAAPGDCSLPAGTGGTYLVATEAGLQTIGTDANCLDESLVQTANITLTASPWVPINNFAGSYDGREFAISGLVLSSGSAGLFNVASSGAVFSNLDLSVSNSATATTNVGALVGITVGSLTIDDVNVTGAVSASGSNVGGIVGFSSGASVTISNSSMSGNVSGSAHIGGLLGISTNGSVSITSSPMSGNVTGASFNVGGLVGSSSGSGVTIANSSVNGDIAGFSDAGGLVGQVTNGSVTITSSPVTGDITSSGSNAGGIAGTMTGTSLAITASPFTGNVSGSAYVGGILGFNPNGPVTITSSRVLGDVTASGSNAGGLVGMHAATGALTIASSPVTGDVTGLDYVGGIVGYSPSATVSVMTSPTEGDVTGRDDVGGVVGFLGGVAPFALDGHSVTGNVTGSAYVGGFVGFAPNAEITIDSSAMDGNVIGTDEDVGGFVGFSGGSTLTVSDSSVNGFVRGSQYVGGLVGFAPNAGLLVESNTVVGNVTAVPDPADTFATSGGVVGGLVGSVGGSATSILRGNEYRGVVSGTGLVGGLIGSATSFGIDIDDNVVVGNVTGAIHPQALTTSGRNIGGLIGSHVGPGSFSIDSNRVVGNVTGHAYVGGIAGFVPSAAVEVLDTSVEGNVTGNVGGIASGDGSPVAGLIGMVSNSNPMSIQRSHVAGNVTGTGMIGGLIGFAPTSPVTVEESFVRGTITATGDKVGGLIAWTFADLNVRSSFVLGNVVGANEVGGLAGWAPGVIDVDDSYFQGTVTATGADKNSFVGLVDPTRTPSFDDTFCTDALCPNANKITVGELQSASFLESRGWDFQNVWCLKPSVNDGFPVLRTVSYVAFTGCWAMSTPSVPTTPIWRVWLDPAEGHCRDGKVVRDERWMSVFIGYRYLPSGADCERDGFSFEGWADVTKPSVVVKMPLLKDPTNGKKRYFLAANADLVAVWREVEIELEDLTGTAPGAFVGGPDRPTREGGGVVDGFYIPPNTRFGIWMLAK